MADDPKQAEKRRKKHAAEVAKLNAANGVKNDGWHYEHGVWYDRNQGDKIVGYSSSEDGEITPRPNMPVPNARRDQPPRRFNDPRSNYGNSETGTPTDPADSTDPIQILADAVAKQVTPDAALTKLTTAGEKPLNDVDAAKAIADRLTGLTIAEGQTATGFDEAAQIIARALPANYRTATILASIELRPYLMALDGQSAGTMGGISPSIGGGSFGVNAPQIGGGVPTPYVLHTKAIAEAETARIQQVLTENGAPAVAQTAGTFSTDTAGTTPLVQAPGTASPVQTVAGYDAAGNPIFTTTTQDQAAQGLNVTGLRALVQGGYYDLGQLSADEAKYQQTVDPAGFFPVEIQRHTSRELPDTASTLDATNYLFNLTPAEVKKVQLRLASAGYFDRLPNGGAYLEGDALDTNTVDAWKLLVTDAVKLNKPAYEVLGQAASTYREALRKERLGQLTQFDPNYSATLANEYAQSKIGKDLTPDQLAQLDRHLMAMVHERAGHIAGSGDQSQQLANTPQGFSQDDVQLQLSAEPQFHEQQRYNNQTSFDYKLRQLMH